ncbi:MAG: YncE family protein, partial [Myxococcota bacterium]
MDGVGILPSGRAITPEGLQTKVGLFPGNMVMTPDGKTLIISNNGYSQNSIMLVDTSTGAVRQTIPAPDGWLFYGLAVSSDGRRFYAAGGTKGKVYSYDIGEGGEAAEGATLETGGYPTGLELSDDGKRLYVTHYAKGSITVHDAGTGAQLASGTAGNYPFGAALSADGKKLYVSNWGQRTMNGAATVSVLDAADLSFMSEMEVGKNPELILTDHGRGRIFVLNSDQETVSIISQSTDTVTATLSMLDNDDDLKGVFPLGAALSADGNTLYVASAARNTVDVMDLVSMKRKGSIPAGWYPLSVAISADGKKLFVLNAKGEGSGDNR